MHDEAGRIVLDSPQTVEAVKFMQALYRGAITEEVFTWDPSSNNRMLLAGHGSLTLNAISITRTGETQKIPIADQIYLAPAARGPVRQIGLMHLMHAYVIWKFARNPDGAKQFLVDYTRSFRDAFLASRFYNIPCFPATVPDLKDLVARDDSANPPDKYALLAEVENWTTTIGYPGYANAVIDETFSEWIISDMFAAVARDRATPEEAVRSATARVNAIHAKWKAAGKV